MPFNAYLIFFPSLFNVLLTLFFRSSSLWFSKCVLFFFSFFCHCSVDYILNVTREIDNFFPGLFAYHNIRVYDEETTDLLAHWNEAYHFINKAK